MRQMIDSESYTFRESKDGGDIFSRFDLRWHFANDRGATMLQFAIALPMFMMFVIVIVDYGRINGLTNVIRESLALGMQQAISVPNLDVDPGGLTSDDFWYQRSKIARTMVQDKVLELVGGIGMISTEDDSITADSTGPKLYDLVFSEDRINGEADRHVYKVAVLLPGECLYVPALNVTDCNRETLGTSPGDPYPAQAPEVLVRKHPIKLVAYAYFDAYTPWLFGGWRKFEQYGYRQPIPRTPFPSDIDPQPVAEIMEEMVPDELEPLGTPRLPDEEESEQCEMNFAVCIAHGGCPCANVLNVNDPPNCECRRECCGPR